ncbi:hypothetical protein M378DRAFT_168273 [Amanita muscaria Koide BX008]|uniref:Uncharacterized protein n=1 Tax=Amanita muscaria (strain Koide BX008) TaxID=946122 RepID=A0A0C2WU17_AMAMK|nr:hypothetical protein M378DRAFT_168273 [Amanita muscaria Koide BX008]
MISHQRGFTPQIDRLSLISSSYPMDIDASVQVEELHRGPGDHAILYLQFNTRLKPTLVRSLITNWFPYFHPHIGC